MSLYYDILEFINQWMPSINLSKELEYRNELVEYIREAFNRKQETSLFGEPINHRIKKESKNIYADIDIDDRIGIEMKLNLKKSEVNNLYGQISGYVKEYECTFVVLCGDTKDEVYEEVLYKMKQIEDVGWGTILDDPKITVIRKG